MKDKDAAVCVIVCAVQAENPVIAFNLADNLKSQWHEK